MVKKTQMQNKLPWITIIGIGEDGLAGLNSRALRHLRNAEHIFGGARHLAFLTDEISGQKHEWPKPFLLAIDQIKSLKGKSVVVLASGDPMYYGVGATFHRYFRKDEIRIISAPSSFSLAAARMGWALQEVECLSIHGRPLEKITPSLQNGAKLIILSNDSESAGQVGALLVKHGFGDSEITIFENLGGPHERTTRYKGKEIFDEEVEHLSNLNILAIDCHGDQPGGGFSRYASLPDIAFAHDGQITKQDIRAVTMAHLAPRFGELLWDIGAGCGSISIEWMRANSKMRAIAVEQNIKRSEFIAKNAHNLGVPDLKIINGKAPEALKDLMQPDAIFIGGGFTNKDTVEYCWDVLKAGGRLIANTVTLESEALAQKYAAEWHGRLIKISTASAEPLGRFHVWRQALPITILVCEK